MTKPMKTAHLVLHGDCDLLGQPPDASPHLPLRRVPSKKTDSPDRRYPQLGESAADLVITSPPYEDAREYGDLQFKLKGDEWLKWALARFLACLEVCSGPVCWVIDGRTRKGNYSFAPERLALALSQLSERRDLGLTVPKPLTWKKHGVPGKSNWFRGVTETIVCAARSWPLPKADFKQGPPPKYRRGGKFSNRTASGKRVEGRQYPQVEATWLTDQIEATVGGGHLGSDLAHENEAPFPESLVEVFVRCFTYPGDTVLDPFSGSGTTAAVAKKLARSSISIDSRIGQCQLTRRRLAEIRQGDPIASSLFPS